MGNMGEEIPSFPVPRRRALCSLTFLTWVYPGDLYKLRRWWLKGSVPLIDLFGVQ